MTVGEFINRLQVECEAAGVKPDAVQINIGDLDEDNGGLICQVVNVTNIVRQDNNRPVIFVNIEPENA